MTNPIQNLFNNDTKMKLKLYLLDSKLTLRKFKKNIEDNHVFHNIKKFYLVFFILSCLVPLYAIKPYASSEDSKLIKLASQLQEDAKSESNTYLDLSTFTPNLKDVVSTDFTTYNLKKGETQDVIAARFPNLNKETINLNNQNREWKEGLDIIIPKSNGYLIGFNKETKLDEYSLALSKSFEEVKNLKNNKEEGFLFVKTEEPKKTKAEFEDKLREIQTPQAAPTIKLAKSNNNEVYSNKNGDLSAQFTDFVNRTRGRLQHDGNGWYPGECVSLVKQWQIYLGGRSGVWPGGYPAPAYYAFLNGNRAMAVNTPTFRVVVISNINALSAGDIMVTTGYPSHTGISTGRVGGGTFDMYDQNSPFGSAPKMSTYQNRSFLGALRYVRN